MRFLGFHPVQVKGEVCFLGTARKRSGAGCYPTFSAAGQQSENTGEAATETFSGDALRAMKFRAPGSGCGGAAASQKYTRSAGTRAAATHSQEENRGQKDTHDHRTCLAGWICRAKLELKFEPGVHFFAKRPLLEFFLETANPSFLHLLGAMPLSRQLANEFTGKIRVGANHSFQVV